MTMTPSPHNHILPHALPLPVIQKLKSKHIVLASSSPRRKDILQTIGISPNIVPSTFLEDLKPESFPDPHEFPVATATHKAVEVYERLVEENPEDPPDLVIAADTTVLTHPAAQPISSTTSTSWDPDFVPAILNKPTDKEDNLRMLLDLNGGTCEVVTGVVCIWPVLTAPGYAMRAIDERTVVHFADNPRELVEAYVNSGEGLDRAGGFAIQGLGGLLIRKIDGDYQNVVGFPAASFFKLLELLYDEETDFLEV